MELAPGTLLGHCKIVRRLGQGSMGVVYEAIEQKLGRHVALKLLAEAMRDRGDALERFWREARAASSLNHPAICTIHELDESAESPFIVMELLEGSSLEKLYRGHPMPYPNLIEMGSRTISFAGWNCDSCQESSFHLLHNRWQSWNDKAAQRQTMLRRSFRNTFTTAVRLAMHRSVSHLRVIDGSQRQLPQVRKLWRYEWLLLITERSSSRLRQMTLESRVDEVCARSILFWLLRMADKPARYPCV
jgi:hypothetical protein